MNHKIVSAIFLVFSLNSFAQISIEGNVKSNNDESIPYCSVVIEKSKIGTISDKSGRYKLIVPDTLSNAAVIFDAEGYVEKKINTADLQKNKNVFLDFQNSVELKEVVIKSKKLKEKVVGQKSRPFMTFSNMYNKDKFTIEQGNIFKIYEKTIIESFGFHVIPSSRYEEVTLKLNIYDVKENLPNKSILTKSIIYKTITTGWQNIDLSEYHLKFKNLDRIAITLQLVDYVPQKDVDFIFGISAKNALSSDLLFRPQNKSDWEKRKGIFLTNIKVKYDKTNNQIQDDADIENIEYSELDKERLSFQTGRERGLKTEFGKSVNGKFINLSDAKIYYEEYGEGEPLFLLEGNSCLISDFYNQIPFFQKKYRVIAIDTRNQGKSLDFSPTDYGYEKLADDLYEIIKYLKLEKVNIVGWSDGGIVGLLFNYKYPDITNKLVTIGANTSPVGVKEEVLEYLKTNYKSTDNLKDRRRINLLINHPNIKKEELQKIANPVLVIAGDNDVIKEEHTKELKEMIRNSELEIIKNSTHNVTFDQPEILNERILKFLEKEKPQ